MTVMKCDKCGKEAPILNAVAIDTRPSNDISNYSWHTIIEGVDLCDECLKLTKIFIGYKK